MQGSCERGRSAGYGEPCFEDESGGGDECGRGAGLRGRVGERGSEGF
uniref:H/ACA ribonucleoprotein complex subunit 1 n=1 Tax=Bartonella schoenbuchensis (strain DSM 13525 / NCTC 13165 / R1) TaxID=687861 RepID=E6Z1E0_BARSR